jgi:hypothetical protein
MVAQHVKGFGSTAPTGGPQLIYPTARAAIAIKHSSSSLAARAEVLSAKDPVAALLAADPSLTREEAEEIITFLGLGGARTEELLWV